jgi:4-amino-4-deoxy-L-arabinose transferase-like glycosyltransferase
MATRKERWLLPLWMWTVLALLWFGLLGYRALIHSDEGRYAEIAREFMITGDWTTPRLDGLLYFEKPAFQYWITVIAYKLFGVSEFTARIWPALSGFLAVITAGMTAGRLWGSRAGAMTVLSVVSMVWVIANGHYLTLDMGLTFFLTLALCGFLLAANDQVDARLARRWMLLAWAAMAGAMLSKGLIGLIIPGGAFTFYFLATWPNRSVSRTAHWRLLRFVSGPSLFLLLAAPWFVEVSLRNPGFAYFFFIHEHFERFLTHEAHREGPIWFFLPWMLVGPLPWTTLLPGAIRKGFANERQLTFRPTIFLLAWVAFVFIFFSVSGSKLSSYILPLFPALGIIIGPYLADLPANKLRWHLIAPAVIWLSALAIPLLHLPQRITDVPASDIEAFVSLVQLASVSYVACTVAAFALSAKRDTMVPVAVTAISSLLALNIAMVAHDHYAKQKTTRQIAPVLLPYLKADTPVFSVRTYDQTLPFYLNRLVTIVDYKDELEYGETAEPAKWLPSMDEFTTRWRNLHEAMAVMGPDTFKMLQSEELPMKIVYQDSRRIVVIKDVVVRP